MRQYERMAVILCVGMSLGLVAPATAGPRKASQVGHRAAIDMGSSSFKMLVTDKRGTVVHDEKISVGLGAGAAQHGLLLAPKTQLAKQTLARFIEVAKQFGVKPQHVAVIATAAVRNAKGPQSAFTRRQQMVTGRTFMTRDVRGELGLVRAKVLAGKQEALIGFQGALIGLRVPDGTRVAILDTGGGSHQLTVGTRTRIDAEGSTQVGSNTVAEQVFVDADGAPLTTITAKDFVAADAKLVALVPSLPVAKAQLAKARLAAIGGTAKYLSAYFRGSRVTRPQLDKLRHALGRLDLPARAKAVAMDASGQRFSADDLQRLGLHEAGDQGSVGAKMPAKLSLLVRLMDLAGVDTLELSPTDARHALVAQLP